MIESRTITFDQLVELIKPDYTTYYADVLSSDENEAYRHSFSKLMYWIRLGHQLGFWGFSYQVVDILASMINQPNEFYENWLINFEEHWEEFLNEIQKIRYENEEEMKADEE